MSDQADRRTMEELIERSSLGSIDARRARARASPVIGRALARAAAERSATRRPRRPPAAVRDERRRQDIGGDARFNRNRRS